MSSRSSKINRNKSQTPRDSRHVWKNRNHSTITESQQHIWSISEHEMSISDRMCRLCAKLPMLHPFGPFRNSWDVLIMIMLIYTSLEIPFTVGFGITLELHGKYSKFGIIALIIDICLLIDIIFNFRTAYFDKYDDLRLITNPKKIATKYLKAWFVLDLLTSFPFEFILAGDNNYHSNDDNKSQQLAIYLKVLRIFRLFRIFKILRLLKMVKIFDGFISHIIAREILMVLRLFKVLCLSLLTAHMCACLWYYVGCKSYIIYNKSWLLGLNDELECSDDDNLFLKYSYSWYWSVVTLFTTGYGDIIATNPYEQWSASLVILIGTCLFGYFVGTLTSLITEGDRVSSSIVNKIEDAQHFCQQKRLPPKLARAVLTHTRYHCNNNYVLGDENDVLANLPSYLAMDVSLYVSNKYLENLDFFGNKFVDPYVRGLIALKMKSISCNKGYKLFVKGDIAEKVYIQRIGKATHYIYDGNGNKKPYEQVIQRGDVVGEYAFILKKRNSSLICETWCEFYVLDVNDIIQILQQHYHQNWYQKLKNMKQFIKIEYSKQIKNRKKRQCLLKQQALLPTLYNNNEIENSNDEIYEGGQGHCDWGDENNDLKDLDIITNKVMSVNNEEDIQMSLNELSKHAHRITQLTKNSKQKSFYLKKKIRQNSERSHNIPKFHKTKSLFGLGRDDSLVRHLEVTRKYKRQRKPDDSSSDEQKYDVNDMKGMDEIGNVEQDQLGSSGKKTVHNSNETLQVAGYIEMEMMNVQSNSHLMDTDNEIKETENIEERYVHYESDGKQSNNTDSMSEQSDGGSRNTDSLSDGEKDKVDDDINKKSARDKPKRNFDKKKKRNKKHKPYH